MWSGEVQVGDKPIFAPPNSDFVGIAAGFLNTFGIKSDGSVRAWGFNDDGQCNASCANYGFVSVTDGLGLRRDNTIEGFWSPGFNAGEFSVPSPNTEFVGVSSRASHTLGLKSDGRVIAWGGNSFGESVVPEPNSEFVAIAAGMNFSIGLKLYGSITTWGCAYHPPFHPCTIPMFPPSPNRGFVDVEAGYAHGVALRADGSVVTWGCLDPEHPYTQCTVPENNSGFIQIAAGTDHNLALRGDGSVEAWGLNFYDQCEIPTPNVDFVEIAGGLYQSLGRKSDNSVIAWGCRSSGDFGQCDVPVIADDTRMMAAGTGCSYALQSLKCTSSKECDDGLYCTVDQCDAATNLCIHTPDNNLCNDDIACTVDLCHQKTGLCLHIPDDRHCDDAVFCNGLETCDAKLGCEAGAPPTCRDNVGCTMDTCNSLTDVCVHTINHAQCDNGLYCDGQEQCDLTLGCLSGTPPCAPDLVCNEETDTCGRPTIPTVSDWGIVILALVLLIESKVRFRAFTAM